MPSANAPQTSHATAAAAPTAPQVARGGRALLLRHGVAFGVNALGGIYLARVLGAAPMGLYFTALTAYTIQRQCIDFGVTPYFIRQADESPALGRCFWLQALLAAVLLLVNVAVWASGATRWLAPEHARTLNVFLGAAAVGAAAASLQTLSVARLERRLDYARIGRIEVLEPVVFMTVALVGAKLGYGIHGIAAGFVLRGWVPALVARVSATFPIPKVPPQREIVALVRELLPFVSSQSVLWAILAAPPLVVGRFAGAAALGHAQLAYSLLGSAGIPAAIFQRLAFAVLSRRQADPAGTQRTVRWALYMLGALYVPAVFTVVSFAPLWVPRVSGVEWRPMVPVLVAGAVPVTLTGLLGILYAALLARGRNTLVLRQNSLHAILYWITLLALVRPWGAMAVPAAHLAASAAGILYARAYRDVHERIPGAPAFLAVPFFGLCAAAALWGLAHDGIAIVVAGWGVMLALTLWFAWRRLQLRALWRRMSNEGAA